MAEKYSDDDRAALAAKGHAMPDGSYPIADEEDLGNAIHAVGRGSADHDSIRKHIIKRAAALGKSSAIPDNWNADGSLSDDGSSSRSAPLSTRSVPVELATSGRTVEAYAAIFNTSAPVHDQDGHYEEVLDPSCFNKALSTMRQYKRQIPVLLNHGMTLYGTPSEGDALPIGVTEEIHADSKGLFTRARFHDTPRANNVLECIKDGSITAYSFQGRFTRSDPGVPHGGFRKERGSLRTVRRLESTLKEYGPATFPVYEGAEVVGVRAEHLALMLGNLDPDERQRLAEILMSGAPTIESDPPNDGAPDQGPAPTIRQQVLAAHARFLIAHGGKTL